jgi:hypothetical protein
LFFAADVQHRLSGDDVERFVDVASRRRLPAFMDDEELRVREA